MQDRPLEDWEYPDPPDDDDDDSSVDTYECPECGTDVYDDAVSCPVCGHYLTKPSSTPLSGRPWWFVALAILGIVAFILLFAL